MKPRAAPVFVMPDDAEALSRTLLTPLQTEFPLCMPLTLAKPLPWQGRQLGVTPLADQVVAALPQVANRSTT